MALPITRNLFRLRKVTGDRCQEIFLVRVARIQKSTYGDRRDVAFMDRRERRCAIRPSNRVAAADLRSPPVQRVSGKRPRAEESPFRGELLNHRLDFGMRHGNRVGLPVNVIADKG